MIDEAFIVLVYVFIKKLLLLQVISRYYRVFDKKVSISLGFEVKFADRMHMKCVISSKTGDQCKKSRKIRLNSELVRLLGENRVKDLLKFFEDEASKISLKTGTDK